MKTRIAVVMFVAVAVLVTTFGLTRSICSRCAPSPSDGLRDLSTLSKVLALTPLQVEQAAVFNKDYSTGMDKCCEKHCNARSWLAEELSKDRPDSAKVRGMIEQMAQAQMDSDMATAEYLSKLRNILNPEQSEKLGRIVSGMLSGACPMGAHRASSFKTKG